MENLQNSGDKNGAKALAKQWRWLAQDNGKSLYTKIDDIESKYKIEATWGDYNKLISQSMQTVWHRTLMDISEFDASGNADKSLSMMIMTTAPNEKPDLSEQPDRSIRNEVENEYRLRR